MTIKNEIFYPVSCLLLASTLASCASDTPLFSSRTLPDETRVIDGPTLAVPPDFALRPPRQGEDATDKLRAEKTREAQTLLLGAPLETETEGSTTTESWLLGQAGTADENIRETLTASPTTPVAKPTIMDRLMGKSGEQN